MASQMIPVAILIIFAAIFGLLSPPCMAVNVLYRGESLRTNEALAWNHDLFIVQPDCNVVLYKSGGAIWSTGTQGRGTRCVLTMQTDGNLVLYSGNNAPLWASNTQNTVGNYILILQEDGNVVLYGTSRWATGTNSVVITQNSTSTASPVATNARKFKAEKIDMVTTK